MSSVVVIGAGITGITSAYALLDAGHDVTVIDRHRYAAMETSFANGGQLSASNAEVWNTWPTVLKGLRWMLTSNAPLLVNPRPTWHKISWMAEFLGQIRHHEANTIETTRLAIEARRHLFAMAKRENIDFSLKKRGILHFYRSPEAFDAARQSNQLLTRGGLERREVTASELREIEPALPAGLHAGFFTESDASGDIHAFTQGLANACERRGARIVYEASVENLRARPEAVSLDVRVGDGSVETMNFDRAVVCAGVGSRDIARMAGDRINIYPVKGYSITVALQDAASRDGAPTVSLLDEETKIVASRLGDDRFRVAGTAELNGHNLDIRADRVRPLEDWTKTLFPAVSTANVTPWAGLRPMTPNMMPRVGPGRAGSVFYNTGHGHLGWTLSAATAYTVAGLLSGSAARPAKVSGGLGTEPQIGLLPPVGQRGA